jgi:hypothetical protein
VRPATSANLGPGFDCLAVALDWATRVVISPPGRPLAVRVTGEGAGELAEDDSNLVCRALATGLASLDGLALECRNRIPLGRGLGSSSAAVCAGLVAANALGGLRWTPDELLAPRHRAGGPRRTTPPPASPAAWSPCARAPRSDAGPGARGPGVRRRSSPRCAPRHERGPLGAAGERSRSPTPRTTLAHAVGLTLALGEGRLDDLPDLLATASTSPTARPRCRGSTRCARSSAGAGCRGATISGSGRRCCSGAAGDDAGALAAEAERVLARAGVPGPSPGPSRVSAAGVRARWTGGADLRLARAVG